MENPRPAPGEELNPGDPTPPRQAATVILLRGDTDSLEVLLVQRNPASRFMGGAWVFPGGAVHDGDGDGDAALRSAAVREVREEAGIELGDPGALIPFSRWITPAQVTIRFDTWFFLAAVPPAHRGSHRRRRGGRRALVRTRRCAGCGRPRRADARLPHDQASRAAHGVCHRTRARRPRVRTRGAPGTAPGSHDRRNGPDRAPRRAWLHRVTGARGLSLTAVESYTHACDGDVAFRSPVGLRALRHQRDDHGRRAWPADHLAGHAPLSGRRDLHRHQHPTGAGRGAIPRSRCCSAMRPAAACTTPRWCSCRARPQHRSEAQMSPSSTCAPSACMSGPRASRTPSRSSTTPTWKRSVRATPRSPSATTPRRRAGRARGTTASRAWARATRPRCCRSCRPTASRSPCACACAIDAAARWIELSHSPSGLPLAAGRACLATDSHDDPGDAVQIRGDLVRVASGWVLIPHRITGVRSAPRHPLSDRLGHLRDTAAGTLHRS